MQTATFDQTYIISETWLNQLYDISSAIKGLEELLQRDHKGSLQDCNPVHQAALMQVMHGYLQHLLEEV